MTTSRLAIPIVLAVCGLQAWGQSNERNPQTGYVYPAGGKRGTTFHAVVGGQSLRGADAAHVSGDGVHAKVVQHYPPFRNLEKEQRVALAQRFRELFTQRWSELVESGQVKGTLPWGELGGLGLGRAQAARESDTADPEEATLPEHPLLHDLDSKNIRELVHVLHALHSQLRGQPNAQLASTVLLEITVDRDAEPGDRELRLGTQLGITNPITLQVGALPETRELEGGDGRLAGILPAEPPLELPVLVNGQIMPGDVDRFRFRAHRGQRLVIDVSARRLIPYLADAVPGWFQATVTLRDAAGNELAYVDDYRFNPDPVLLYEVPEDGDYELEIRDSIYRGREDFVYRISLAERPFITSAFPLGCRSGQRRYISVYGWNLTTNRLFLNARSDDAEGIHHKPLGHGRNASNVVAYSVIDLHADDEIESNDSLATAQRVRLPRVVDGRIEQPGDVDIFEFEGKAGDEIVAEVIARRVHSPLDSLLRLTDAAGNVLAWNDDCEHKEGYLHTDMGVLTHHADSYLRAQLPQDGLYYMQIADTQSHGGESHAYRLRIGPPQPDFELRVTPSSINVRAAFSAPLRVYALRKDGFEGEIELSLRDAPPGFSLAGARIPAGRDCVRVTLHAPRRRPNQPLTLTLEGRAMIDGWPVTHRVVPAEDMMQAFLYRHLTPAQELMVAVQGSRLAQPIQLDQQAPVRIPYGGTASVRITTPPHPKIRDLQLELNQPPPGIKLQNITHVPGGMAFELATERDAAQPGLVDNLIIEAFIEFERPAKEGQAAGQRQRIALGTLPAIPFEIVQK